METTIAISNYFIQKSMNDGSELTPMKLVKLAYLAHGWHLALSEGDGEPLLSEFVYAWKYGPVVRSVYNMFKEYGKSRISSFHVDSEGKIPSVSNDNIKTLLDKIWETYKSYSGPQLSTLTHESGSPWDTVWNVDGGKHRLDAIIPNQLIRDYYRQKIN